MVLAAALLHATWNLVIKGSDDRLLAAWAQVAFGALVFAPVLLATGIPVRVLPAVVSSSVVHLLYGLALVAAYERGDLSLVYPVARGSAPVLITAAAVLFLDDLPPPGGLVAIALVASGVVSVAGRLRTSGLGWAAITGVAIATYTSIDAAAVRSLESAAPYTIAVFVGNGLLFVPVVAMRRSVAAVAAGLRAEWRRHLLAGAASAGAYMLVLAAARLAPLGLVAALRETSVLFGVAGGWLVLGERGARRRLLGAALIAAGLAVTVVAA